MKFTNCKAVYKSSKDKNKLIQAKPKDGSEDWFYIDDFYVRDLKTFIEWCREGNYLYRAIDRIK